MTDLPAYLALRGTERLLSALPRGAALALGDLMGRLAHRPLGVRRAAVDEHLRAAFPDRDPAWRRRVALGCYRHFGRELTALARLGRTDPERLAAEASGTDRVRDLVVDAAARGPGAVVVTGHLGNWELAGAVLAGLGVRVSAVVKRQGDPRVHRRLGRLRRGLGVEPVEMREASRRLPEVLRDGGVAALVADQDAGGKGIFVPFLGRPASTFRGPARLALRHGVPLLFGALVRDGGGYRAIARRVWDPDAGPAATDLRGTGLTAADRAARGTDGERDEAPDAGRPAPEPAAGGKPADRGPVRRLTLAWTSILEEEVRDRPEQYFWFHRRWKTRPPRIGAGADGYPDQESRG